MTDKKNWRTPGVVIACAGLAMTIVLGTRHGFGLYLQPMTIDLNISRETFAFAIALQNLFYGFSQPLTGMIADKFGAARVMAAGTIAYAIGLALMSYSTTGMELNLSAGLFIGIAMGCCGFSTVYGVIGRTVAPEKRSTAMGIVGAAGSMGQFLMLPYGQLLINHMGWQQALLILAVTVLLLLPLSSALVEDKKAQVQNQPKQSIPAALKEAFGHRGFMLMSIAYTVCGFQLLFVSVHFPAYLIDQKMSATTGMLALALIGLFNTFGSFTWGWLGSRYTKKYLLATLYFTRAMVVAAFILTPLSPLTVYLFASAIGFLWLGTAPITSALIAQIFGARYLSTLSGCAFMFHQVGSFLGVWLGGRIFDATGSYMLMWWITIAAGIAAALLCLPVNERQIVRGAPSAA
ncbi:MAG: MFS transporter [Betaproteobacteria bacterium]|nr:MFS transporter [Betaproteobacteria bacterium]